MKNITLHLPSVLAGLGLAALIGLAMGQQIIGSPAVDVRVVEPIAIHSPTHPKNFVRIEEGQQYTVPTARLLVVRQVGWLDSAAGSTADITVYVNGAEFIRHSTMGLYANTYNPGIVLESDSLVEVKDPGGDSGAAVLLGYLVDA